ncbi:MAG TPA: dihydrofolate reductase family protein [Solirubrobacterales bacterium]|jgi:dihydrofolate reductase
MGKLIYTANVSLDGRVEDERGTPEWGAPDEEVFGFLTDHERPIGTYLYGRRMYETMAYWESQGDGPDDSAANRDFARIWRAADKVVFSRTLETPATARTRVERAFDADLVRQLKDTAATDITIGGAELAGQAIAMGLVDELNLVVVPVLLGKGKRALPEGIKARLELLDEIRFAGGTVYLRYRVDS